MESAEISLGPLSNSGFIREIQTLKKDLFQLLRQECLASKTSCFLRYSENPSFLLVTDAFRRIDQTVEVDTFLEKNHLVTVDYASGLKGIDFSETGWKLFEKRILKRQIDIPSEMTETGYCFVGLYRLLMRHPSPIMQQPMNENRKVLTSIMRMSAGESEMLQWLWEETALHLRKKEPCAVLAGQILMNYYIERIEDV